MGTEPEIPIRSGQHCDLCKAEGALNHFPVPRSSDHGVDQSILLCAECHGQLDGTAPLESDHWRVLTETMWSPHPPIQVMAWRILRGLRVQAWAADALDLLYLDEDVLVWAQSGDELEASTTDSGLPDKAAPVHTDSNGSVLTAGDTVTLIKDLKVKGAGFTAKRGTAVRGISLVGDNVGHIEGRVNGQQIVILTEFVRKSG